MIRMICCDLDGTLMPYGSPKIDDGTFALIKRLVELGVAFCPASGRQYPSLSEMFAPVAKLCRFICGNGAVVCDSDGKAICKTEIPKSLAAEIVETFLERSDGKGEIAINGEKTVYLMSRGKGVIEEMKTIKEECRLIRSPEQIEEPVTKVSLFVAPKIDPYASRFEGLWDGVNVAIAGRVWLDATCANKGTGMKKLCDNLGIPTEDVAAFGDNWNDVPMLDIAGHPFIVKNAAKKLLEMYPSHAESPQAEFLKLIAELESKR